MRLSPAQKHLLRVHAAAAIAAAGTATGKAPPRPAKGPEASAYDLLLAQLGEDLRRLQDIKSVVAKIEAKKTMIAAYDEHVLSVLAAGEETGKAVQDEIFVTLMIWRFDIGDFALGLDMADYVLKHGLTLPERYNRTAPTLIAEEVAEAGLNADKQDLAFPVEILQRADALTAAEDMNDKVRAKLQKALGLAFRRRADAIEPGADGPAGGKRAALDAALSAFLRARHLFEAIGVVKQIEQVKALLGKEPTETA